MAKNFRCSLVTPQHEVLEQDVSYASIPAHDGQLGVMHQRAPLLVKLGDGALRLDITDAKDGAGDSAGTRWFFVGGGFAQMKDNKLTLLASEAVPAQEMSKQDAQAALKEAQARVANTDEEVARRDREMTRARTMLRVLEGKAG